MFLIEIDALADNFVPLPTVAVRLILLPCGSDLPHLYVAPGYIPSARPPNAYLGQNLQNYVFVQILPECAQALDLLDCT